jgi:hypothetical protein
LEETGRKSAGKEVQVSMMIMAYCSVCYLLTGVQGEITEEGEDKGGEEGEEERERGKDIRDCEKREGEGREEELGEKEGRRKGGGREEEGRRKAGGREEEGRRKEGGRKEAEGVWRRLGAKN